MNASILKSSWREEKSWPIKASSKDRSVLRSLAAKVAELASQDIMAERRQLWTDLNALRPIRPLILAEPDSIWNDYLRKHKLKCESQLMREWESQLLLELYRGETLGDDYVVAPHFKIPILFEESEWGSVFQFYKCRFSRTHKWTPPLQDWSDLKQLKFPKLIVHSKVTDMRASLAHSIFGDLLEVQTQGRWWWTLGLTRMLIYLRGQSKISNDICDSPKQSKALIKFLCNGILNRLDKLEANNLLTLNNDNDEIGSGGLGYCDELGKVDDKEGKVKISDLWGFTETQEIESIHPDLFEEFFLPYLKKILRQFGLTSFGCCEAMERRWRNACRLPNLRRVSVSHWCDLGAMAVCLDSNYVFSLKCNPYDLAGSSLNKSVIRKKLRRDLQSIKGCHIEIIMRDPYSYCDNPGNLKEWVKIARAEAAKIAE